jgi:hypothetical protein
VVSLGLIKKKNSKKIIDILRNVRMYFINATYDEILKNLEYIKRMQQRLKAMFLKNI